MFSYSHTAPIVAPEQEEKEYADLDQEEKENILNDIYGRNAEETEEFNRREITQQQLDEFQSALDRIPLEDRTAYQLALIHCPELLQSETSPRLFLIREAFDPNKAAQRLVRYWDMRVDLFGDERAFLPISLLEGGALEGDEELLAMMRAFPNFRNFLPNDEHGRTIIYCAPDFFSEAFNNYSRAAKVIILK